MPTAVKFSIPQITDYRLAELAKRIRPVEQSGPIDFYYLKPCDLRCEAFTWDAKRGKKAPMLREIGRVRTLHTYGYYGFFKPTIAEVLAQIPEELLGDAIAFKIKGPQDTDDLNDDKEALNQGFHVARTIIYAAL